MKGALLGEADYFPIENNRSDADLGFYYGNRFVWLYGSCPRWIEYGIFTNAGYYSNSIVCYIDADDEVSITIQALWSGWCDWREK